MRESGQWKGSDDYWARISERSAKLYVVSVAESEFRLEFAFG
jgi:hypothetical protein